MQAMRKRTRIGLVALAAAGLLGLAPGDVRAHHGWSGYDASRLLTLTGTVESVSFESPHGLLMLQTGEKLWRIVLAPPSRLARRGLPAGSITAGEQVTVEGYPHRNDPEEFRAERIQVKDATVELR
jgi:hypothetical protein